MVCTSVGRTLFQTFFKPTRARTDGATRARAPASAPHARATRDDAGIILARARASRANARRERTVGHGQNASNDDARV